MATTPSNETVIKLDAPVAMTVVAPAAAAGLVPLKADTMTKLQAQVDDFVSKLVADDAASPEFGKRSTS